MIGVVLCGGRSIRMGSDKGLLFKGRDRWAEVARIKLQPFTKACVFSVNPSQLATYSTAFSGERLVPDDETLALGGPLTGILSVHQKFRDQDLLVLACDLPEMKKDIVQMLVELYRTTESDVDAMVFRCGEQVEPLCGVYSSVALGSVLEMHRRGGLHRFSMMHVLEQIQTHYIPLDDKWWGAFRNANSPKEQ